MEHIKQMQTSVQNQKGLKGWLKRKLFGSVLEAAGKDDDILLKIAAETRDNAAKSIAALQELEQRMRAQQDTFRQDFENACVNLRNNNAQISSMQSQMDCIKVQQRQLQRQQAEAPAAVPAETAAAHDSAPAPAAPAGGQTYDTIEYFDFENHFRGSIESIKQAQKQYLPYFEGKQHVLDFGCGRGEFLSLMRDQGIPAEGVDLYAPYAEYCTMQGLKATCGDGISYLSRMQTVDGIFAGQVVEHLTPEQIMTLCNTAYEKLEAGGCLVVETPNPLSLSIYTNAFYIDPSHVKPVHPLTMQYYLEKAGFENIQVLYPESSRPAQRIPALKVAGENVEEFNTAMQQVSQMLYGSHDYAVIAVKA